jgi:choline dehydrogenase
MHGLNALLLILLLLVVSSNLFPNGGSLDVNETYNAEQLALYQSAHKGAYTLVRGTGNNIVLLPLKNTTISYQSIINLAASQNATALLPAGTHPTVVAGYKVQRKILRQNYASYGTSIGSISWNTGPQTSIYMIKPFSRGTITTVTTDILIDPVLDFGALTDPTDLEVMVALVRKNRQIMAQAPMQALGPTELLPGDAMLSDEDLKAVLRDNLDPTNAHMCCTTAMLSKSLGGVVAWWIRT